MEWLNALRGTTVAVDTAPFIYFIEENPVYLPVLQLFFRALDHGDFRVVTSVLTLTEVLVHPLRNKDTSLANQYRRILLHAKNLETLSITHSIAEEAAELRGDHGLRTPDAIQLSTARTSGASSFLTNDGRFRQTKTSLRVLLLSELTKSVS